MVVASPANTSPQTPKFSPGWWRRRLDRSMSHRRGISSKSESRIRNFVGPHHSSAWRGAKEVHSGAWWKLASDIKPSVVSTNPAVFIDTFAPDAAQHADALRFGLNAWINRVNLFNILDRVADDMLWDYGVLRVRLVPRKGSTLREYAGIGVQIPALIPDAQYIMPPQFGSDPDTSPDLAQFQFHWEIRNLSELAAETDPTGAPLWDLDALQKLSQEPKPDDLRKDTMHDDLSNEDLDRDEVVVFHVWCRVTRKVYCIGYTPHANEKDGVFLRQPTDYFGHPAGPYVIFGVVWIRGQAYPVSLTALFERNVAEQDEHRKKARDDARAAKKMLAVEGAKLAKAIVNKENNGILAVDSLTKLQELEFGGVQPATADYMAFLDNDWEMLTGLSQVRQGNVDADATATAVVEASSAADRRVKYIQSRFRACTRELLTRVAWLMWSSDMVEFPVPVDDPMTGQTVQGFFRGGVQEGDDASFEDLELDIEPFTLEHVDQNALRSRMTEVFNLVTAVVDRILANPLAAAAIGWEELINDTMETLNVKKGGRRYIKWPMVRLLVQMQIGGIMGGMGLGLAGGPAGGAGGGVGGMGVGVGPGNQSTAIGGAGGGGMGGGSSAWMASPGGFGRGGGGGVAQATRSQASSFGQQASRGAVPVGA